MTYEFSFGDLTRIFLKAEIVQIITKMMDEPSQETQRMLQKPDPGISATPHEDNLRYFNVVISGPQDSAYERKLHFVQTPVFFDGA